MITIAFALFSGGFTMWLAMYLLALPDERRHALTRRERLECMAAGVLWPIYALGCLAFLWLGLGW